jgi:hypothetical protein
MAASFESVGSVDCTLLVVRQGSCSPISSSFQLKATISLVQKSELQCMHDA